MVWDIDYYPFDKLHFTPAPRRAGEKGNWYYADCICAFDIETSTITVDGREQAFMYVWQFCIDKDVIIGRTWGDFKYLLYQLRQRLGDMHLCIFDHNLSFEMQYLAGVYHFNDYEVFCTDSRKVLKCTMYNRFEFRCSYKMTNLSLDAFTRRYKVEHIKRSGVGFDYSKVRYPDTPLTHKEMLYSGYDVLRLVEAVKALMELNEDNLYSLPLTSTGFVRRNVKSAMREYRFQMQNEWPPFRCYLLFKSNFRGGNTHANRFYSMDIVGPVITMDISSSYPSQQCNKLFPVGRWKECISREIEYLHKLIDRGSAVIMRVALSNVELRDKYNPVPYIPIAKCIKLVFPTGDKQHMTCIDNGRVLQAAYIEMCLTDIDFRIIVNMYKCDVQILEMYRCWYDYLPEPIRQQNIEYFKKKTELKGVEGQELFYHKNKELLNSIYGMSVQDPVKERILFDDLGYTTETKKTPQEIYEAKAGVAFTQYAYGVWTTAHAREALQAGLDLCGDNLVYCDTDSCKFLGEADFSAYNKDRIAECLKSGLYANDPKGVTHYGGVYEFDGKARRFITLGAKKYAYEDMDGNLHITVSGVSKKQGAKELAAKGGLEAFKPGFIFTQSGKTESVYNDQKTPILAEGGGGELLSLSRNVVIRETTYTLSVTGDYEELLNVSANMLNKVHKHWLNCQLQL